MKYRLFVRWNMEPGGGSSLVDKEGHHTVELVHPDGSVVSSHTFCNNNDRLYGYCMGMVEAFNFLRLAFDPHNKQNGLFKLEMPHCIDRRGGVVRHLTSDTSRQD